MTTNNNTRFKPVVKYSDNNSGLIDDTMANSGAGRTDFINYTSAEENQPIHEEKEDYIVNKNLVSLGEPTP